MSVCVSWDVRLQCLGDLFYMLLRKFHATANQGGIGLRFEAME